MKQDFAYLLHFVPDLLKFKTLLYIGARPGDGKKSVRMNHVRRFLKAGYKVDILEVWPPNVEFIREWNAANGEPLREIIEGDVRELSAKEEYDVVMFWHGPEHVPKEDLKKVLDSMVVASKEIAVIGCPLGEYVQGDYQGNPYEEHLIYCQPDDFISLGWKTIHIAKDNINGDGNIMAWFRKEENVR